MSVSTTPAETSTISPRERELAAIITAYNDVTDKLKGAHERLTREVGLLRDQLAEKDRELARRERLAALGEMAAGVAHEIRNPLGGIQLFASLLERDLEDRPKLQTLATKISKGVRTLDGIVRDILAFAGPGEVELRPVDLAPLVVEAIELAAPQQAALQIGLQFVPERFDVAVQASPVHLQRAVLNLVLNGLDAAGEGGRVWVDCRCDDDWVFVDVADDGPGVPTELAERIFNPFFTAKDSGTGLGLAIVHRVAETHGGSIRVADRDGGGAWFTLSLRRVDGSVTDTDAGGDG